MEVRNVKYECRYIISRLYLSVPRRVSIKQAVKEL